jgi:hypothetical protein
MPSASPAMSATTLDAFRIARNPAPLPRPHAARDQTRVVLGLFCAAIAVFLLGAPSVLRYLYPAAALLVAIFLFVRSRTAYIGFVCWLYFLSPLLRRVVDFRSGFVPVSPLLLAPILATLVAGTVLATRVRKLAQPGALPFTCALAGVLFGTAIGLTHYTPTEVGRAFLNWIPPIVFGFFLYEERDRYPEYRRTIERALVFGTLLLAAYGVVQFFVLLPWDRQWMFDIRSGVFGLPEPMKARIFGTMNAPATYATYMMAGLLLLLCLNRRIRLVAAPLAFLALLFTSSRASWVGLASGVLYLIFRLSRRARLQLVAGMLICMALAVAAAVVPIPELQEMVSTRLKSLTDPNHDVSYNARIEGHLHALASIASEPFGEGLGSTDTDHATDMNDDSIGPHDSTLLECLFALGGPGTLLYCAGILFGVAHVAKARSKDPFFLGMTAIFVGYAAECLLNSIFVGVLGFMVWLAAGMALAAAARERVQPAHA